MDTKAQDSEIFKDKKHTEASGLLAVCYAFPPIKRIGSVRNYEIVRRLGAHLGQTQLLTTGNRRFLREEPFPMENIAVEELKTWDFRKLTKTSKGGRRLSEEQKTRTSNQFLMKLLFGFPFNLLVGEGGLIYIIDGYTKAKKSVRAGRVSHLYSSYRPYADHFICYLLKRKFPQLYWIADFRDLHVDPILQQAFMPKFQEWCNRKILSHADLITTVSNGLSRHLQKYSDRVYVLRNGITRYTQNTQPGFSRFTLCYAGSLFQDYRDPSLLFRAISELVRDGRIDPDKIQLIYAGKDNDLYSKYIGWYDLQSVFRDEGLVSMQEARELQNRSHINILLTYASSELDGNITGKFYDYLTAGKPILALIKGEPDRELMEIIEELNAGIAIMAEEEELEKLKKFLLEQYQSWLVNGESGSKYRENELRKYYWSEQMEGFLQRIKSGD